MAGQALLSLAIHAISIPPQLHPGVVSLVTSSSSRVGWGERYGKGMDGWTMVCYGFNLCASATGALSWSMLAPHAPEVERV